MERITKNQLRQLEKQYPEGTRLELLYMDDPYAVPEGTIGEVDFIDAVGSIHMNWETGSSLALILGVDRFRKV